MLLDANIELVNSGGLLGVVVAGVVAYFKYSNDRKNDKKDTGNFIETQHLLMAQRVEQLEEKRKEAQHKYELEVMAATHGRHAIKAELEERIEKLQTKNELMIKEREQVLHDRVDRVRDDNIKSYEKLDVKVTKLAEDFNIKVTALQVEQKKDTEKILNAIMHLKSNRSPRAK